MSNISTPREKILAAVEADADALCSQVKRPYSPETHLIYIKRTIKQLKRAASQLKKTISKQKKGG